MTETLKALERLSKRLPRSSSDALVEVAQEGASYAEALYAISDYDGPRDYAVTAERTGGGARITASGASVLFMEYGTGITYSGDVHPWNAEHGMGPGTWPDPHYTISKSGEKIPNWANPKGWWFGYHQHTYGNPPAMAMYQAYKLVQEKALGAVERELRTR